MCVFVSMQGCPSQQLTSLNSVVEMTNRAAFFGFLQLLKLAILSLASHSWFPRPWNWVWLWVHSWSDSMLVVRLFLESWVAVTLTGVLCSFRDKKRICGEWQSHHLEKHLEIQHHTGNCFLLTSLCRQLGIGNFIFPQLKTTRNKFIMSTMWGEEKKSKIIYCNPSQAWAES